MAPALPGDRQSFTGHPHKVRGLSFRERSMLSGRTRVPLWSGLSLSIGAHVLAFGGALAYAHFAAPRTVAERPIVAKLVRLGKPRDEKLLPRLPAQPPPPPPPAAAPPAPQPAPPPVAAPQQVPAAPAKTVEVPKSVGAPPPDPQAAARKASEEALERQRRMMEALSKLGAPPAGPTGKVQEELPGKADGDPQGDAEDAAEGDRYLALVEQALRRNYAVPTVIPEKERLFLKCKIFIRIGASGKIDSFRITEPSGNSHFDRAVEASIQRTFLAPPPPAFFKAYGEEGIEIGFRP